MEGKDEVAENEFGLREERTRGTPCICLRFGPDENTLLWCGGSAKELAYWSGVCCQRRSSEDWSLETLTVSGVVNA